MDINATIINNIDQYLYSYGCEREKIDEFMSLVGQFDRRQKKAIEIIEDVMSHHHKRELRKQVAELARIEYGIRTIQPWLRDHVVHALLSYLLGIYIKECFWPLAGINNQITQFQWKLAGLFHDIGYPAQAAKDILKAYTHEVNDLRRRLGGSSADVKFGIIPLGFENLTNSKNAFALIQDQIDEWNLDIDAKNEFDLLRNTGNICHGIISSLTLLNILDLMYQKHNPSRTYKDIYVGGKDSNTNWNQEFFDQDIIPACAAIYVHNLPPRCFNSKRIDPNKAPLAYLLKLSDTLQDWERPSEKNPSGFSSNQYDIKVINNELVFTVAVSAERKQKIDDEIDDSLITSDLRII